MTETDDNPAEPTPSTAKPRVRLSGTLLASVLAAVFGVTTVLLAIVAVGLRSDRDEIEDTRREVEAASARFVQAFVDFRFDDVATLRDDVVPLTAEPFTEQFVAGVPTIQALNESLGRSSEGTVKDVFVASVEGGQATVIVVYDAVETFAAADPQPLQNFYVRLGLVELDGEWRVNDVISLNLALQGPGGPATATTSTTLSG